MEADQSRKDHSLEAAEERPYQQNTGKREKSSQRRLGQSSDDPMQVKVGPELR